MTSSVIFMVAACADVVGRWSLFCLALRRGFDGLACKTALDKGPRSTRCRVWHHPSSVRFRLDAKLSLLLLY